MTMLGFRETVVLRFREGHDLKNRPGVSRKADLNGMFNRFGKCMWN